MENQNPQQEVPQQTPPAGQTPSVDSVGTSPLGGAPAVENSNRSFWKTLGIGLSIVSFCIAIAIGGYFYVASKNKAAKISDQKVSTVQETPTATPTPTPILSILSDKEKQQIDTWIIAKDLNPYGDSKDSVYAGGNPLFNEVTGKTIDKYAYIADKYTAKPWCTPRPACLDETPSCMIAETADMCPARIASQGTQDSCSNVPKGLKIDSSLYLLTRTDCTQSVQTLIQANRMHVTGDKVQVYITLFDTSFVLNAQMGTEETRSGKTVQASVYINKLLDLSSDPKIQEITLPEYGITN